MTQKFDRQEFFRMLKLKLKLILFIQLKLREDVAFCNQLSKVQLSVKQSNEMCRIFYAPTIKARQQGRRQDSLATSETIKGRIQRIFARTLTEFNFPVKCISAKFGREFETRKVNFFLLDLNANANLRYGQMRIGAKLPKK